MTLNNQMRKNAAKEFQKVGTEYIKPVNVEDSHVYEILMEEGFLNYIVKEGEAFWTLNDEGKALLQ